jgi:hypothetical protein
VNLPAGNFVISAKASITLSDSSAVGIVCQLQALGEPTTILDTSTVIATPTGSVTNPASQTLSLLAVTTFSSQTFVSLICHALPASGFPAVVVVNTSLLTATQVGSIVNQVPI